MKRLAALIGAAVFALLCTASSPAAGAVTPTPANAAADQCYDDIYADLWGIIKRCRAIGAGLDNAQKDLSNVSLSPSYRSLNVSGTIFEDMQSGRVDEVTIFNYLDFEAEETRALILEIDRYPAAIIYAKLFEDGNWGMDHCNADGGIAEELQLCIKLLLRRNAEADIGVSGSTAFDLSGGTPLVCRRFEIYDAGEYAGWLFEIMLAKNEAFEEYLIERGYKEGEDKISYIPMGIDTIKSRDVPFTLKPFEETPPVSVPPPENAAHATLPQNPNLPEEVRAYVDKNLASLVGTAKHFYEPGADSRAESMKDDGDNLTWGGGYEILFLNPTAYKENGGGSIFSIRDMDYRSLGSYMFALYVDGEPSLTFEVRTSYGEPEFGHIIFSGKAADDLEKIVNAVLPEDGDIYVIGGQPSAAFSVNKDGTEYMAQLDIERDGEPAVFMASDFVSFFNERSRVFYEELEAYKKEKGYREDEIIIGGSPDYSGFVPTHFAGGDERYLAAGLVIGCFVAAGAVFYTVRSKKIRAQT